MSEPLRMSIIRLASFANAVGMIVLSIAAATMVGVTFFAAAGVLPWLDIQAGFGGVIHENAGQFAQIGLTVLLLLLTVYLPSARRVLRLETSHRDFQLNMDDVARAYTIAHAADRASLFSLSAEYDAVRERMVHLRDHPDLQSLEPAILEVAAQMSRISQGLADTYSDENVARAKALLTARQQEIEAFNSRLDTAKQIAAQLKNWKAALDADEGVAESQLNRLRDVLLDVMPELSHDGKTPEGKVVTIPRYAAE